MGLRGRAQLVGCDGHELGFQAVEAAKLGIGRRHFEVLAGQLLPQEALFVAILGRLMLVVAHLVAEEDVPDASYFLRRLGPWDGRGLVIAHRLPLELVGWLKS
jgi:hypothetical protein